MKPYLFLTFLVSMMCLAFSQEVSTHNFKEDVAKLIKEELKKADIEEENELHELEKKCIKIKGFADTVVMNNVLYVRIFENPENHNAFHLVRGDKIEHAVKEKDKVEFYIQKNATVLSVNRGIKDFGKKTTVEIAATPVGNASDQCWQYTIINDDILHTDRQLETTPGNFTVQSKSIEDGQASWVICCNKDENGKCIDCREMIELEVIRLPIKLDGSSTIALKIVVLTCINN